MSYKMRNEKLLVFCKVLWKEIDCFSQEQLNSENLTAGTEMINLKNAYIMLTSIHSDDFGQKRNLNFHCIPFHSTPQSSVVTHQLPVLMVGLVWLQGILQLDKYLLDVYLASTTMHRGLNSGWHLCLSFVEELDSKERNGDCPMSVSLCNMSWGSFLDNIFSNKIAIKAILIP